MLSLVKETMKITIVDDIQQQECDAGCGLDWSSPETIALAKQRIKDRFGDKIELAYLDLSKAKANRDTLERQQAIKAKNLSLPLLLLNGHPRLSGQFDIRQLLDTIEAEMEISTQR